jgi:hypothetical protein
VKLIPSIPFLGALLLKPKQKLLPINKIIPNNIVIDLFKYL